MSNEVLMTVITTKKILKKTIHSTDGHYFDLIDTVLFPFFCWRPQGPSTVNNWFDEQWKTVMGMLKLEISEGFHCCINRC
jgi:hypothetical protein